MIPLATGRNEQSVDIASYASGKSGGGLTRKTVSRNLEITAQTSVAQEGALRGKNVTIQADQDVALEGGRYAAKDSLTVAAGRTLSVVAAESSNAQRQRLQIAQKDDVGIGRQRLTLNREVTSVTPDVAQLAAQTVTLQSGRDMNLVARRLRQPP